MDIAKLSIDGKTGKRTIQLIWTVPYLQYWLGQINGSSNIWVSRYSKNKKESLSWKGVSAAISKLAHSAGIDKHITLYSFRHGRNTEVCEVMTYAQQCEFAGWRQGSPMPRIYNHLTGMNTIEPLLAPFGIQVERQEQNKRLWIEIYKYGLELYKQMGEKK